MLVFCVVDLHIRISYGFHFCTLENNKKNKTKQKRTIHHLHISYNAPCLPPQNFA